MWSVEGRSPTSAALESREKYCVWVVIGRNEAEWEYSERDWEEKEHIVFFRQNTSPAPESRCTLVDKSLSTF